jgi:hypothetical protein
MRVHVLSAMATIVMSASPKDVAETVAPTEAESTSTLPADDLSVPVVVLDASPSDSISNDPPDHSTQEPDDDAEPLDYVNESEVVVVPVVEVIVVSDEALQDIVEDLAEALSESPATAERLVELLDDLSDSLDEREDSNSTEDRIV